MLADAVVEDLDLHPPVDVERLVTAHADIRRVYLEDALDVDAVMHGLDRERFRPIVVLNDRRPARRIRFTLAHELAHLLIAWHIGTIGCQPIGDDEDHDEEPPLAQIVGPIEHEADAFAARLLVPARFVASLEGSAPGAILNALEQAQVSPPAALRSITALLSPGYVFALLDSTGRIVRNHYSSAGTPNPGVRRDERLDEARLGEVVDEHGRGRLDGRPVWWGRYRTTIDVPEGTHDWQGILLDILADASPGEGRGDSTWRKVNGVASAANNAVLDAEVGELAARLHQQFRRRSDLVAVTEHPRFADFVLARARAFRASKVTRSR